MCVCVCVCVRERERERERKREGVCVREYIHMCMHLKIGSARLQCAVGFAVLRVLVGFGVQAGLPLDPPCPCLHSAGLDRSHVHTVCRDSVWVRVRVRVRVRVWG